jgi:hypothetical protein
MTTSMNVWRSHVYRWCACVGMLYNTIDELREEGWDEEEIWCVYGMVWHGYMNCLSDEGAIWNDYTSMRDVERNMKR